MSKCFKCDVCGKIIEENHYTLVYKSPVPDRYPDDFVYDLCGHCFFMYDRIKNLELRKLKGGVTK